MPTSRTPHFRAVAVAAHAAAIVAAFDRSGVRDLDPGTFPMAEDEARHTALVAFQRSEGTFYARRADSDRHRTESSIAIRAAGQRAAALLLAQRRAATCPAPRARVVQVIKDTPLGPQFVITGAPRALPLDELQRAALQDDPDLGGRYAHLLIQAHALLG